MKSNTDFNNKMLASDAPPPLFVTSHLLFGGGLITMTIMFQLPDAILSDIISAYGYGLEYMLNHNTTFSIGKYNCDDKKPSIGEPGLLQIITRVSSLISDVSCSVEIQGLYLHLFNCIVLFSFLFFLQFYPYE